MLKESLGVSHEEKEVIFRLEKFEPNQRDIVRKLQI